MVPASNRCSRCGASYQAGAPRCSVCGMMLPAKPLSIPRARSALVKTVTHGSVLKQRYRVLHQVGRGGFGYVYKALDTHFGDRAVALKEMGLERLNDQERIEGTDAFRREAFLLAGLTHPHLPSIYDYFSENGNSYLVMSFIEGETLDEYLSRSTSNRLQPEEVINIALQLCSVLGYLHSRRPPIIFRDLKPANVMRTPDGQLYLIDFGVARHFKSGQSRDTVALGSPGYAAPEQYGKAQTTPLADIYSLGATLHHLLSGVDPSEHPFSQAPLRLPGYHDLGKLVMRMLENAPADRPSSVQVISQELQHITESKLKQERFKFSKSSPGTLPVPIATPPPFLVNSTASPALPPPPPQPQRVTGAISSYSVPSVPEHSPVKQGPRTNSLGTPFTSSRHPSIHGIRTGDHISTAHSTPLPASKSLPIVTDQGMQQPKLSSVAPPVAGQRRLSRRAFLLFSAGTAFAGTALLAGLYVQRLGFFAGLNAEKDVQPPGPGQSLSSFPQSAIFAVTWLRNGKQIAYADGTGVVTVANAEDRKVITIFTDHTSAASCLALSPNGKFLAAGGYDLSVFVWSLARRQRTSEYSGAGTPVYALAWSPDNRAIVSTDGKVAQVWVVESEQSRMQYNRHQGDITALSWSPDRHSIASGSVDQLVHIWEASTGKPIYVFREHKDTLRAVNWSPDGHSVASADNAGVIYIWTPGVDLSVSCQGHEGPVMAMNWSPDQQYVATASWDKTVRIWSTTDGQLRKLYQEHKDPVLSVAWSPDGRTLASSDTAGNLHIWQHELPVGSNAGAR